MRDARSRGLSVSTLTCIARRLVAPTGLSALMVLSGWSVLVCADSGIRSTEALVFNCFTCHGTDGRSPGEMHSLNGKSFDFVRKTMNAYKAEEGNATIMNRIAKAYTEDEITRIARYIADLR